MTTKPIAGRRRLDPMIIILSLAIAVFLVAIGVLMVFSIDRTSWAFALYEHGRAGAAELGRWAAWVLEGAAVAFIAAEIVIDPKKHRAQYFYVLGGLILILAVQGLSNGIAGWTNGWNESRKVIGKDQGWGLAAASALWATVNASLPILIFILSKLLAWLIRQLISRLESENLTDVQAERAKLIARLAQVERFAARWEAAARRYHANNKELGADLAALRSEIDGVRKAKRQLGRNLDRYKDIVRPMRASLAEARQIAQEAHKAAQAAQEARRAAEIDRNAAQAAANRLRAELAERAAAPPVFGLADIAAKISAGGITIGDIARATLAHNAGRKEATAAALGGSMNALNKWLELPGAAQVEEVEVTA